MANIKHKHLLPHDNHGIYSFVADTIFVRNSMVGFTTNDIGKVCWQKDTDTFWVLKSIGPPSVWKPLGSAIATIAWNDVENKPDVVTRTELDEALDAFTPVGGTTRAFLDCGDATNSGAGLPIFDLGGA